MSHRHLPFHRASEAYFAPVYRSAPCWLALLCFLWPNAATAQTPADFAVNSVLDKTDSNPGDGKCSTGATIGGGITECTLRAAIDEVNALAAANPGRQYKVSAMPGTYSLSTMETCVYRDVGSDLHSVSTSVLCVSGNLALVGADPTTTFVDHALQDRDFFISADANVIISNMTIQNGGQYGGSFDGGGGGVNNQGNLTLSNVILFNNYSEISGGAVFNAGNLVVEGCTVEGNRSDEYSSAGIQTQNGTTSVDLSYFFQNHSSQGVALGSYLSTVTISNSTVTGNVADQSGVINSTNSPTTITNSTISGNTIGNAGAVVGGPYTLNNDTIYGNTAGNAVGGVLGDTISIANTIIYGNTPNDCSINNATDLGHNLFGYSCPSTNSTTKNSVDPKLGAIAINGGRVQTQTPLAGSPAIDGGSPAPPGSNQAGSCTALDERGFVRGRTGNCSIGAAEPLGAFVVSDILPKVGAPGASALVLVQGNDFLQGTTVTLKSAGHPTISALQTTVSVDTFSLSATLDLSKAANGVYDVVVTKPDNTQAVLAGGFTVETAATPKLYSFIYGHNKARAGVPAYYTVVYGNESNVDAYLVPLTLSTPGADAGLITSSVLPPPAATGQVITDWTGVPVEVGPFSTTGFTNTPLIIPVIPAGSGGILQFNVTAPIGTAENSTYEIDAYLGTPYSSSQSGAVDPSVLTQFVSGAQNYAQTNLSVKLSSQNLAAMSTYASAQLAQEVTEGVDMLLSTESSRPVFFSSAQLLTDIAFYGASLASGTTSSQVGRKSSALAIKPDNGGGEVNPVNKCGAIMSGGAGCVEVLPTATPDTNAPKPGDPNFGKITLNGCLSLPYHHVSADGTKCVPNDSRACPVGFLAALTNPGGECNTLEIIASIDPNEKDGPPGIGSAHFTQANLPFQYQIEFENSPSASAAAQTVVVTDPLDKSVYDFSTFELGPISFGPYSIAPSPGLTSFTGAVDLRPTSNVIVAVKASLDNSAGVVTWTFTSLDPGTMQAVTDPTAGFLPPDTTPPAGIGHVAFTVQPLPSLVSGTKLCNTADVVFDTNSPIATAPFCNSKDTLGPVSSVTALPPTQTTPSFTVSWSGSDEGVGLAYYMVYVSVDSGPFTVWQAATVNTSASYTGAVGHSYAFYSIAVDLLGNVQAAKTKPDTTTSIGSGAAPKGTISSASFGNVDVGVTSAQTIVLANSGTVPFSVGIATITGSGFVYSGLGACPDPLPAGQTCTLKVAFSPTLPGLSSGSLTVVTGAGTLTANLSGTGIDSGVVLLTTTNSISAQPDGSYSVTVTVKNLGSLTASSVTLSSITLGSAAGAGTPKGLGTVAAGESASATFTVPASAGSPGAASVLKTAGTYTGGSFSANLRVTLP